MIALGQRHYAPPMCSVSFILGPVCGLHLDAFAPRQLPLNVLLLSLVVFQPIPSLRLIYRSFLRTVVAVKCDNDDVEYTPPRND
jgi:hypothetical protein